MQVNSLIWLGLAAVFLVVEAACPIHLVSVWFGAGALAAMLVSVLGGGLWLQVTVFLLVSGLLLALLWPLTKKYLNPSHTPTNLDAIIGKVGLVTAAVDNVTAQGQVKLDGMEWTARSTSGAPIPQGTKVRADRIEGVRLYVSPVEAPVEIH